MEEEKNMGGPISSSNHSCLISEQMNEKNITRDMGI